MSFDQLKTFGKARNLTKLPKRTAEQQELCQTRIGQFPSPRTPAAGLSSSQMFTGDC